jgi:hypothetical protein
MSLNLWAHAEIPPRLERQKPSEVRLRTSFVLPAVLICAAVLSQTQAQVTTQEPFPPGYKPPAETITTSAQGSTYVPMDSWIYPAMDRLHSLGYLDSAFLGIRPWTRLSIAHMLEQSADRIDTDTGNDEARSIYLAVLEEVQPDIDNATELNHPSGELESVYTNLRGISGTPLRDSFTLDKQSSTIMAGLTKADLITTRASARGPRRDGSRCTGGASINMHRARPATRRRWRLICRRTSTASR